MRVERVLAIHGEDELEVGMTARRSFPSSNRLNSEYKGSKDGTGTKEF